MGARRAVHRLLRDDDAMEVMEWAIVGAFLALACIGFSDALAHGIREGLGHARKLLYWFHF